MVATVLHSIKKAALKKRLFLLNAALWMILTLFSLEF